MRNCVSFPSCRPSSTIRWKTIVVFFYVICTALVLCTILFKTSDGSDIMVWNDSPNILFIRDSKMRLIVLNDLRLGIRFRDARHSHLVVRYSTLGSPQHRSQKRSYSLKPSPFYVS